MKNFFHKLILFFLIINMMGIQSFFVTPPKEVHAQWLTSDIANTLQNTWTAISTSASSVSEYTLQYKETILDGLAYNVANMIIEKLAADIVDWINGGFEGSPAFVTDPGGFFIDLVDEQIGQFIAGSDDLKFLCSPFDLNIRLALAFKYQPRKRERKCKLSDVIKNSIKAGENASINGFTAGDFKQGGWPSFVSMTTEPANNPYGSFLEADWELGVRIGDKTVEHREELGQGKGFFSFKKCVQYEGEGAQAQGYYETDTETGEKRWVSGLGAREGADTEAGVASQVSGKKPKCKQYETQTPGSVIEAQANNTLASGQRRLEMADEINEIVGALFAQLVKMALTGGLKGVSGNGGSDKSYYEKIEAQQKEKTAQYRDIQAKLLEGIGKGLEAESAYRSNKNASLEQVLEAKRRLEDVQMCYQDHLDSKVLTEAQQSTARQKILIAQTTIDTKVIPYAQPLITEINNTQTKINTLLDLRDKAQYAESTSDLAPLGTEYGNLIGTIKTTIDIGKAGEEISTISKSMSEINSGTYTLEQECQLFPQVTGNRRSISN